MILRLCRYGPNRFGVVEGASIRDVTPVFESFGSFAYPLPTFDPLIAGLAQLRSSIEKFAAKAPLLPLSEAILLSPVANPRKIIAAPMNYRKHAGEVKANRDLHHDNAAHLNEIQRSGLFLKATSSLVDRAEVS
jgi:2,4-didehydro-3-deoxy-L-rhamnonate hydrolase